MLGFQAKGAAPIVHGYPIEKPETVATAIRIGNPAGWKRALKARDESEGSISIVTDDGILAAYHLLASKTGIFCEPASAASVAGLLKLNSAGYFKGKQDLLVVCILTGHGLKDPDNALKQTHQMITVPADYEAIRQIVTGG